MSDAGEHRGVKLLIIEGWRFHREGRYAEALRAAEKAGEGAKRTGDIRLELWATRLEADALQRLGRYADALTRFSWILGVAEDPVHRIAVAEELVAFDIMTVFTSWIDCATYLPQMQVDQLFGVLDAGDRFARALGKPTWRGTLLATRARLLGQLGRLSEAIGFAEEGLALVWRDRTAPGLTLGSHRYGLGDLLCEAGRFDKARTLYETMLDDAESLPNDRLGALRGLARCALTANEGATARGFAAEAVRVAEPMGDPMLSMALEVLTKVCLGLGDLAAARAASDRHLEIAMRLGVAHHLFSALTDAVRIAFAESDPVRARTFLTEAQPHAEALDRARSRKHYRADLDTLRAQLAALEAGTAQ